MPDIPLFEPLVLRGVVEKLTASENLVMLNQLPRTPWPYPNVTWDVIKGSRQIARPNVPNSEAHIVPRMGISQESASFVYLREKKVFQPTTLHWLRAPGTLSNKKNAETAVLREIKDLNQRFDNFAEWCCWQALSGQINFDYPDVQANVDMQFPASHKPTLSGTGWALPADPTDAQIRNTQEGIISNIRAWKKLISRDAQVAARTVYLTEATMDRVFTAFAANIRLLSDRMKEQYYTSGTLPGFMGLDWNITESYYDTDAGVPTMFLPDDALLFANLTDNRPIEIFEGPTADDDAPDGFTGKYSKTFKEPDPSARQILLEWHMLPVITRPEQFVYVADVAPGA